MIASVASDRQIRVFVSSTFRDMHAERDHLVSVVFPELRERVERLGFEFFDVDLRWGVPERDADGERANSWEYCRQWIDRVEPLFICLLGQRYGWVAPVGEFKSKEDQARQAAMPRSITEFEVRHAVLNERRKRRSYFYLRETTVPLLLPDATVEQQKFYADFVDPPELLQQLDALKADIRNCGRPVRPYVCHWSGQGFNDLAGFGRLVLEDLWSGVLRDPRYVSKEVWRQALGADPDTDARYTDESHPVPEAIAEKIVALAKPPPVTPLDAERQQMDAFAAARLRWFQGRSEELEKLAAFACSTTENTQRLAVVTAVPGQGKSALLAKLHSVLSSQRTFLITHFIGATERSASSYELVRRVLDELDASGIEWLNEKTDEEPKRDFNSLCARLSKRLSGYDGSRRIVLLIDALSQLSDGHDLFWLPQQFGAGVRAVVSSVNDPAAKEGSPEQSVLRALDRRQSGVLRIPLVPLAPKDVRTIVVEYLREYCKELDAAHVDALCALPQASNPLYLLVALGELRTLGGNNMRRVVPELIASLSQAHPDTVSLFKWVLHRLEVFGAEEVKYWCLYLASGRVGMASRELGDLLRRRLGEGAATKALLIERGIRRYLQRRGPQLDFFHGQFRHAVIDRYGPKANQAQVHLEIAAYFNDMADPERNQTWQGKHQRPFLELPFNLFWGNGDELAHLLCNYRFLAAKINLCGPRELVNDYDRPLNSPQRWIAPFDALKLVRRALRLCINILANHPEHLAPQLLGRLLDDHTPLVRTLMQSAAQHGGDGRHWLRPLKRCLPLGIEGIKGSARSPHLDTLKGFSITPDGTKIISWDVDALCAWDAKTLNLITRSRAPGYGCTIQAIAPWPDSRKIAVAMNDSYHTVFLWNIEANDFEELFRNRNPVTSLAAVGKFLVVAGMKMQPQVWNIELRQLQFVLHGEEDHPFVTTVVGMPDGNGVIGAGEQFVCRWSLPNAKLQFARRVHHLYVDRMCVTSDGRWLLTVGGIVHMDKAVRSFDCSTGAPGLVLEGHENGVVSIALESGLGWVYTASRDHTVRMWDLKTGVLLKTVASAYVWALTVTSDDYLAVDIAGEIQLWDRRSFDIPHNSDLDLPITGVTADETGRCVVAVSGKTPPWIWPRGRCQDPAMDKVQRVAITYDARILVTASETGSVKLWTVSNLCLIGELERDGAPVQSLRVSAENNVIIARRDGRVSIWDIIEEKTPRQVACNIIPQSQLLSVSLDGRVAVCSGNDVWEAIGVYSVETGNIMCHVHHSPPDRIVDAVALSDDGRRAAVAAGSWRTRGGSVVVIEDLQSTNRSKTVSLENHTDHVSQLAFSPDGKVIVICDVNGTLLTWDIETRIVIFHFSPQAFCSCGFADDGQTIVAGDRNGYVHILRRETG